jgi:hypothetical protein
MARPDRTECRRHWRIEVFKLAWLSLIAELGVVVTARGEGALMILTSSIVAAMGEHDR